MKGKDFIIRHKNGLYAINLGHGKVGWTDLKNASHYPTKKLLNDDLKMLHKDGWRDFVWIDLYKKKGPK